MFYVAFISFSRVPFPKVCRLGIKDTALVLTEKGYSMVNITRQFRVTGTFNLFGSVGSNPTSVTTKILESCNHLLKK